MGMNFVFSFSNPTLVFLLRWSSALARLVDPDIFLFMSVAHGAWIWGIVMGTRSFGAFTALHSLCIMFDLMTFAFGI